MSNTFLIELKIRTLSPVHIGTGEGFAGIIDRQALSYDEEEYRFPIILGHTVKGIIRSEFYKLASLYKIDPSIEKMVFGDKNTQGSAFFSPWTLDRELKNILMKFDKNESFFFDVKSSNQIDRFRKVAKHEHLFSHEVVKDNILWEGCIRGEIERDSSTSHNELPIPLIMLLFSIKQLTRIGGRKRAGAGECEVYIKKLKYNKKLWNEQEVLLLLKQSISKVCEV
ncbi:RAMP superfamily CRISPR-associated protein [Bacillus sp. 165]|uniref:RAMP superfamily CRISPR-associated protein n=1 Tax=Bacillus sp. 165 TaxID=1529117 RepID=UPI001ADD5B56|nr:RAMP superfamily CRISPR-associated protein [Bacillus sp. 165]MBO9129087.1 hypothetical protein [Bacillus sp. 165]